jgi:Zn-dependent peptidase ImmA (M78 family)
MMYVRDRTGRFPQRPHYEPRELDEECERIITQFMKESCGSFVLPIPTEALTKLIERDAADLDLYADLTSEGTDVQGLTNFYPARRPEVRIAAELSESASENRLRTTLTHEYGHVKFHDFLLQMEAHNLTMHEQLSRQPSPKCKRDKILGASEVDWMEWQAGYVSGSLLMPLSHVKAAVGTFCETRKLFAPIVAASSAAQALVKVIAAAFGVSTDAARVRLLKLGFLSERDFGPTLL